MLRALALDLEQSRVGHRCTPPKPIMIPKIKNSNEKKKLMIWYPNIPIKKANPNSDLSKVIMRSTIILLWGMGKQIHTALMVGPQTRSQEDVPVNMIAWVELYLLRILDPVMICKDQEIGTVVWASTQVVATAEEVTPAMIMQWQITLTTINIQTLWAVMAL